MRYAITLTIVFSLASSMDVAACSCVSLGNKPAAVEIRNSLIYADAVFSADVIEVKDYEAGIMDSAPLTKLRVIKSWKGVHGAGSIVKTRTLSNGGLCGLLVSKGEQLLVYLGGSEPYS